ncbi:glycosyltransferase [Salinirubellus salinus]|uniref:Glycosyltransferase n=1 Tax=Salinirubellus salinus TaxID=1364945 RepID=A0A9E7R172_9EURY|nr:glycosyltransferase [Salinirubellus salinus]UWM52750.1 glycosyltransferase [Salinirubellus salinus]
MKVAILHPYLNANGGAESVLLHTIEALQSNHQLTLVSNREIPLSDLNEFFDTEAQVDKNVVPAGSKIVSTISALSRSATGNGLEQLRRAFLNRWLSGHSGSYDLVFSTKNEITSSEPTIQYIHAPQFTGGNVPGIIGGKSYSRKIYERICKKLGGISTEFVNSDCLIANSDWTADMVEQSYETNARVVHPPVDIIPSRPLSERQNGFVCVGRIVPSKNIEVLIDIIDELRNRGHATHLHIVGPASQGNYLDLIKKRSRARDYIQFEGAVTKPVLRKLVRNHKFGIHGRKYEHFGIGIAEMAAAGTIPFVHDSGGQREIVDISPLLTYNDKADAVRKISSVLSAIPLQESLSHDLISSAEEYAPESFRENIKKVMERHGKLSE